MIVAITAFNRPHYLRETVESLVAAMRNIDEPVFVVSRIEPSEHVDEIHSLLDGGRGWYSTVNESQQGHVDNIKLAFEDGFELGRRIGESYVCWLADDLVLAPDALRCSAFMRDRWEHDEQVVSTALHWQRSDPVPTGYYACGLRANIHNSQGHGVWASSWQWHLDAWEPVTTKRRRGVDPPGYEGIDQHISAHLRADDKRQAAPLLARVMSIGYEGGMHATAQTLDGDNPRLFAGDVVWGDHAFREAFIQEYEQPVGAWARYEAQLLRETS